MIQMGLDYTNIWRLLGLYWHQVLARYKYNLCHILILKPKAPLTLPATANSRRSNYSLRW